VARSWPALAGVARVRGRGGRTWFFLSNAEQHITSALAGLLNSAVPLVGVVIATATGNREHLRPTSLSGLLLGLVGVAFIVGLGLRASDWTSLIEVGLVVVGYAAGPRSSRVT